MAKHKVSAANNFALTWQRLSSREIWSSGLFWFAASAFGAATYLMDVLRTENGSWSWAITYSGSLGLAVALALLVKFLILPVVADRFVGLLNTAAALVIGGLKNLSVALLAVSLNLERDVEYVYRFVGGMFMGLAILTIFAAITGSRSAHADALLELRAIRRDLLGSKENLSVLLADELERLQEKSRETVLPKLEQISKLLVSATESTDLISEISETVTQRVRPLMDEIAKNSSAGLSLPSDSSQLDEKVKAPKTFAARDVIRPLTYLAYTLPSVGFVSYFFQGLDGVLYSTVSTISFALVIWLFREFLLPKRATHWSLSYLMLFGSSVVSPVVGLYIIGGGLPLDAHESVLLPFICWMTYIATVLVLTPVILLDSERARLEELIESENELLAKEIAVFEQKLWVFKRRWLFMLHGTVQSALTAALTRLQTFSETDHYQASLVRADLERAEKALQSLPETEIDFEKSTQELRDAWAGVCAISIDVDMRAARALSTNQGTAYCVNEILKEAVGNAVRHGSATAVRAVISRREDDILDLEIENDGTQPPKRWKKGIGSHMLDDITLNWSLSRGGRLTTLKARLPL